MVAFSNSGQIVAVDQFAFVLPVRSVGCPTCVQAPCGCAAGCHFSALPTFLPCGGHVVAATKGLGPVSPGPFLNHSASLSGIERLSK